MSGAARHVRPPSREVAYRNTPRPLPLGLDVRAPPTGRRGRRRAGPTSGSSIHVDPSVFVHLPAEEPAAVGAFLADDLGPLDEARVVDQERAALAAGEVLGLVEALRGEAAERAEVPALVLGEQAMGIVFDDRDAVPGGDRMIASISPPTPA